VTIDALERIEDSLELLLKGDNGLPLIIFTLISIFMLEDIWSNMLDDRALVVIDNVIFANSLMSTIIQDGGKREKSMDDFILHYKEK